MSNPKPLYDAEVYYWTPAGRLTRFRVAPIAANTLQECEEELVRRLLNECKFGRRKVGPRGYGRFTATFMGHQIAKRTA